MKSLSPVFNNKSGDTAELARVTRHHSQIMVPGDSGDLEVIRADDAALRCQIMLDAPILPGGKVIKWKGEMRKEHLPQGFTPSVWVSINTSSVPKLAFHNRTQKNFFWTSGENTLLDSSASILEVLYPGTGVQKISHHQSSRISSTPWSGRTKGASPQSSRMRSQCLTGQPLASRSTGFGSVTSNSFSTCCCSAALSSGGKFRSRKSSLNARALMPIEYEKIGTFATHEKGGRA